MKMWERYKEHFTKHNIQKFEGEVVAYDAVDAPYLNSNLISSVHMVFVSNTETRVSWMLAETCLALLLVSTEIEGLEYTYKGVEVGLWANDTFFSSFDENFVKFILENKISTIKLTTNVDSRDYLASLVRYTRAVGSKPDFDAIYLECIRDPRQ